MLKNFNKKSILLSFWFSPENTVDNQSIFLHQSPDKTKLLELTLDSTFLNLYQKTDSTINLISRSKTSFKPDHWYYCTVSYDENLIKIKVKSTAYSFDVSFPFEISSSDLIYIFKNNREVAFVGKFNKLKFEIFLE